MTTIQQGIDQYVAALQAKYDATWPEGPNAGAAVFATRVGKRYVKVVRDEPRTGGASVEAFVDPETGNVFKPDGWTRPAKGVRYNLATPEGLANLLAAVAGPMYLYR